MGAIWQSPAILLHQRNKGVAEQFLLSLVFSCQEQQHMDTTLSPKYTNTGCEGNKQNKSSDYETGYAMQN